MSDPTICPLKGNHQHLQCTKGGTDELLGCAWWDKDNSCCIKVTQAQAIQELKEYFVMVVNNEGYAINVTRI